MNIHLLRLKFAILYFGCMFLGIGMMNILQYMNIKFSKMKNLKISKYNDNNLIYTILSIIIAITLIFVYVYALKIDLEKCEKYKKEKKKKLKQVEIYITLSSLFLGFLISLFLFHRKSNKRKKKKTRKQKRIERIKKNKKRSLLFYGLTPYEYIRMILSAIFISNLLFVFIFLYGENGILKNNGKFFLCN